MKKFNLFRNAFLKNLLFLRLKAVVLLTFLLLCCSNMIVAQNSKVPSMEGSWGVRLIMQAGSALDNAVDNLNYDYVEYARQINQNYPTAGHVITNLSSNANGANYTMRTNPYVNLAQVDNTMVPSAASQQVFLNTISELRNAGKEVILYFNYTNNMYRGTASQQANWDSFVNSNYGGNYFDAFEDLIAGYVSELAGLVDGYWVDNFAQGTNVQKTAFINRLRAEDPNAFFGVNVGKAYFPDQVDSDGTGDSDPTDYSVIKFDATNVWSDFTAGHITPISQKAPPNSWGYEEFTITDMVDDNLTSFGSETNILKHMFTPIRQRWTSSALPLQFTDQDQAYRFVKRIVDAGGAITFSTTTSTTGLPMPDEVAVLSYVNDQLELNANYVPYVRPTGAFLVGETTPNYNQIIDFPAIPDKDVNDANFDPGAAASSGAAVSYSSSNTSVATIVGGNINIQGAGTTTITASQGGNGTFAAATNVSRQLTVTGGSSGGTNIALNGTATQSTTLNGAVASRAIDGNTNGNFSAGSVTAAQGPNAWWEVDLGGTYSINDINIFNRTNSCCVNRLSNFTVSVINNGTTTFSQTITSAPTPSETVDAGGAVGQIVRIESNITDTLNLAEVEVFGAVSSGGAFVPDSSKTYYIDCPAWNLRLAANGTSDDPYTTSTNTTGSDVEWKFVDNGNGYWHIDRAAGGTQPRLRTDGTANADMNQPGTSANTYFEFSEGASSGTYFLTLPDVTSNFKRLQINSSGEVKMTGTSSTGSWVSFTITEASCPTFSTIEAEGFNAMLGIVNEGSNIGYIEDGDWAMYSGIDLTCASSIDISASSNTNGGTVEVRLGSPTGTLIGTVPISGTGNWGTYTIFDSSINNVSGTHNVYLVFNGGSGYLFNIDWIEFSSGSQQSALKTNATLIIGEPVIDDARDKFVVYPNPTANSVTIDFKSTGTVKMEIIGSLGETIRLGDIENGTKTVDLSGLSSGMYIIKVSDGAETFTKKIIKK